MLGTEQQWPTRRYNSDRGEWKFPRHQVGLEPELLYRSSNKPLCFSSITVPAIRSLVPCSCNCHQFCCLESIFLFLLTLSCKKWNTCFWAMFQSHRGPFYVQSLHTVRCISCQPLNVTAASVPTGREAHVLTQHAHTYTLSTYPEGTSPQYKLHCY